MAGFPALVSEWAELRVGAGPALQAASPRFARPGGRAVLQCQLAGGGAVSWDRAGVPLSPTGPRHAVHITQTSSGHTSQVDSSLHGFG